MQFQIEAIMNESSEYMRRRNLLDPGDQARADYLLERVGNIQGSICYAILMGSYCTLVFFSLFAMPFALVDVLSGSNNLPSLVISGVGIFLALLGPVIYRWHKLRRLAFQRELLSDPRLAKVFETMGFRSP